METPVQAEPKKSNTGLIIGIVVVVLLCCCCVLLVGGVLIARSQLSNGLSGLSAVPTTDSGSTFSNPGSGGSTTTNLPGVPSGGKGDDVARTTAWGYVVVAAATDGCSYNPKASDTEIKVTQDADSSGVWKEEWSVTCDSGSKKAYEVTFTPGSGGVTTVTVK